MAQTPSNHNMMIEKEERKLFRKVYAACLKAGNGAAAANSAAGGAVQASRNLFGNSY